MLGQTLACKKVSPSVCILRLSAIGDVCHAVSAVQALQIHMPSAKLTWIIGKVEYQLVKHLSGVEFIVFDKRAGFSAYRDLWKQLKNRQFDHLLHMQVALRASLVSLCVRAKKRIGFDRQRARDGQWLFTNTRIPSSVRPHVADGFMQFVHELGVEQLLPSWQMPIPDEAQRWLSEQVFAGVPTFAICPSASKAERNWTVEGYSDVAAWAAEQGRWPQALHSEVRPQPRSYQPHG